MSDIDCSNKRSYSSTMTKAPSEAEALPPKPAPEVQALGDYMRAQAPESG